MNLNHVTNKQTGDPVSATEWNNLASDVNELGTNNGGGSNVICTDITEQGGDPKVNVKINTGVSGMGGDSPSVVALEFTKKTKNNNYKGTNVSIVSNNNINIEPRESVGTTKGGNISFKPGDDIEFCSHHRISDNQNEVSMKIIDGDDNPVKLQLNASSITLTTKDKQGDDANVLDINVNSGKNTKGYLKVRAQAIDLRCEANGGIALQPKGNDGQGHENKIKFEHNGGDGKEFGTFNTEKTSIFTDEYRFNENGTVYAVTRGAVETTYKTPGDPSSGIKKVDYPTQADDFKDIINTKKSCKWNDIVNAGIFFKDSVKIYKAIYYVPINVLIENGEIVSATSGEYYDIYNEPHEINLGQDFFASKDYSYPPLTTYQENINTYIINDNNGVNHNMIMYFKSLEDAFNNHSQDVSDAMAYDNKYIIIREENNTYGCLVMSDDIIDIEINDNNVYLPEGTHHSVSIRDIVILVDYFKTEYGTDQGPWASSL